MLIENPYYQVQGLKKEEVLAEFKNLPIWDRREVLEKILEDGDEVSVNYLRIFNNSEIVAETDRRWLNV